MLGRQLTRDANATVAEVLATVAPAAAQSATRIAFTGPPGTGKSTLIGRLARRHLEAGHRVGVLAIDPTSPFTSGAILGDRVRMEELAEHENFFLRSLASRGAHNGLADNIPELLMTMDRHEFDEVIVETVGVGQLECAVRDLVDVMVLVLNPASGDYIQAMKAGVLEAADVIVVNKADLAGSDRVLSEVQSVIRARKYPEQAWIPPVIKISPRDDSALAELDETLARHLAWRRSGSDPVERRRARRAYQLTTLLARRSAEVIRSMAPEGLDAGLAESFDKVLESLPMARSSQLSVRNQ
jgi:LAO/AO transport system kinase